MNRSKVARFAVLCVACAGALAAVVLASPAVLPGSNACACTHGPTEPIWPVSVASARTVAEAFVSDPTSNLGATWLEPDGGRLYMVSDGATWVAVDGGGAGVVAALYQNDMPTSSDGAMGADGAETAATAFLGANSIALGGAAPTSARKTAGPVSYLEVSWIAAGGTIDVAVNAATGAVFWFFDGRHSRLAIPTPAIGYAAARVLALAATPASATPDDGWLNFSSSPTRFQWFFGATTVTESEKTTTELTVDPSSGQVAVAGQ